MIKQLRSVQILLLLLGSIVISSTAQAGKSYFINGIWVTFGSIDIEADMKGIKNPDVKPSIVAVDAELEQLDFYCLNPTSKTISPGESADRELSGIFPINSSAVLTDVGKTTVKLSFDNPEPTPADCVNPNWTPIPESVIASLVSIQLTYLDCPAADGTDANTCTDIVNGVEVIDADLLDPLGNYLSKYVLDKLYALCKVDPVWDEFGHVVIPEGGLVYQCAVIQ